MAILSDLTFSVQLLCIRRHIVWVKDARICEYMAENYDDVTAPRSISTLSYWTLGLPIYLTSTSL